MATYYDTWRGSWGGAWGLSWTRLTGSVPTVNKTGITHSMARALARRTRQELQDEQDIADIMRNPKVMELLQ